MDNWGTETEMICSSFFLDEKTEALGWEAACQGYIAGEQRSWDHCEIPQGLVLYSLRSIGASGAAVCSLAQPKSLHRFLILKEPLKEEQTCLQVQVTWQECTLAEM